MVKFVTKKSGGKVPFDEGKTKHSIMMAAKEAGYDEGKASGLADEVAMSALNSFGEQDTVSTMDIKDKVLAQLDSQHPEVSAAWRKYDQEHGK